MSIKLTKLRLIANLLRREQIRNEEIAYQSRRKYEAAWLSYVKQARLEGLCANCEKSLADCKCTILGAAA